MDKTLIIVNPSAGDERGLEDSNQLEKIYSEKDVGTRVYKTKGNDPFNKIIQEAMEEGYDNLAILGGDGTISEIVNSIAELKKRPKILLLPSGTTNNFARTITENQTKKEILKAVQANELEEIEVDIGRINNQYFISSVAVGVLPAVGWEADDNLKAEFGSFAYFLESLKLVKEEEQESFDVKINIEKDERIKENIFLLIVGLSNSIFGIQSFFEEASVNDGKLHYFALEKAGVFSEIQSMMSHLSKKETSDKLIDTGRFQEAKIESDTTLNFLVDGEKGPMFPVELDILSKHLTFIVPNSEKNK